jgi:hypothetical protein
VASAELPAAELAEIQFSIAALYSKDRKTDEAVENLRLALENGFSRFRSITQEMDLSRIHDRPDFQKLNKEYRMRVVYIPKHIQETQFLQMNPHKLDNLD